MAATQNERPSDTQNNSAAYLGFAKFGALVTGLILLAWALMKLLAVVWPE